MTDSNNKKIVILMYFMVEIRKKYCNNDDVG